MVACVVHAPCLPSPVLANPPPSLLHLLLLHPPLHVCLPSSYSRRTALRNATTTLVCRNQVSGKKSQHVVPCDDIAEEEEEEKEEEEQSPQVGIQNCTYRLQPSSWLDKELPHILSMQGNVPSGILVTRGHWTWQIADSTLYRLSGIMKFCNITKQNEVFINEVSARAVILSDGTVDHLTTSIKILAKHPENQFRNRADGYWFVHILQAGKSTQIKVTVDIMAKNGKPLAQLQALRLDINFVSYGAHGRFVELQHVILPLQYNNVTQQTSWKQIANGSTVLPVRTHLLCHLDDPLEVLKTYAISHAICGDTIVIGETPLAIMQGRFRHPYNIMPSTFAKIACRFFHPTSSLASACGMQALIDIVGKLRVLFAIFLAILGRLFQVRGVFYQLAGQQARLIDDVSGTLPPYDQFITLGPIETQTTVDYLQEMTGFGVAIVDANNLKRVHILAASDKVDQIYLEKTLLTNPAGNADEQTPLLIVRKPQEC